LYFLPPIGARGPDIRNTETIADLQG
jgi:hypothetical protein